ncbi:putative polysaccharide biosynthesis protein [Alkaliphilus hydrothermalis]|uniref:Stage V sporulation protein B n=1 Tax=Alkaliphilus hydrothermalis TaxID=1482730 RepID=A0ABS2NQ99_9FIRM|nr:polysaccharide biosynthesis protein [Alkaliphilus hydrothermalis]MBM7614784.1 stage V sporulation protein B [Alkaliphilus hydrothermalis]
MKKDSFLKGAAILAIAGVITKILGAFFRLPLGNVIGSEGLGYFQAGYPIYVLILAFASQGFPTAISKLVSEKRAQGNAGGAHKVFRTSFYILISFGLISSLSLFLGARFLVDKVIASPNAYYVMLALAPALFFVPILAAFRGYFQGMKNMTPTAVSQVVEQIGRVVIGLALAFFLVDRGIEFAAAGAAFGPLVGAVTGLIIIYLIYRGKRGEILSQFERLPDESIEPTKGIIRDLLKIAIPITLGSSVLPLLNMVDTMIVLRRLQAIGFTYEEANSLFGQLTGMAATLINLPQVFTVGLAMSLVPVISEASAKGDLESVQSDAKSAFRVASLIGFPAAVGLGVLSGPIMQMLFPKEPASLGEIMLVLSAAVLFLTQLQTMTGILQGLGKPFVPVRNLMIGAVVKFVVTYTLTGIPVLNVKGAAIGTIAAYFVAAALNFIEVKRATGTQFDIVQFGIKLLASVTAMGLVVLLSYRLLYPVLGNSISTLTSIGVGAAIYGILLLMTGALTQEDLDLLPGGNKLSKILKKVRLMR